MGLRRKQRKNLYEIGIKEYQFIFDKEKEIYKYLTCREVKEKEKLGEQKLLFDYYRGVGVRLFTVNFKNFRICEPFKCRFHNDVLLYELCSLSQFSFAFSTVSLDSRIVITRFKIIGSQRYMK